MIDRIRAWARALKSELAALASAVRDPRTPIHARVFGLIVIAYALSPIDLIPDFIPVIGFLDDAILLPAGLWALRRMIPDTVLAEHRAKALPGMRLPASRFAAAAIVLVWLIGLVLMALWIGERLV